MSVETKRITNHEQYQAPNGWHYGMSNSSNVHYTHRLYTDKALYQDGKFGWECEVFWDKGGGDQHKVAFYPITKIKQNGDYEYGYPTHTGSFDTEAEALGYAIETAQKLR